MNELQALLLGVVQGLTEFLPISSSGHLIIVPWLLDFDYLKTHERFNKTFDVAVHSGTLVAVLVYFRTEIAGLIRAAVRSVRRWEVRDDEERLAWLIAIATIPAAVVGAAFSDTIENDLGDPWQIAILLIVFGIVLWLADRLPERRSMESLSWAESAGIGLA